MAKHTVTLKSFAELGTHLGRKPKHVVPMPAMCIQATVFFDHHNMMKDKTVRVTKIKANGKVKTVKVPRSIMSKYAEGQADGSTTVTGKYAIAKAILPFLS